MREFDCLLRHAAIIDGTGADRYTADVGIRGGVIEAIGDLHEATATEIVDASGAVLTPGFIDAHSHADCTLALCPTAESCLGQGVTTVVGGNCGLSPAPLDTRYVAQFWEYDVWDALAPDAFQLFGGQVMVPADDVRKLLREKLGCDVSWHTFDDYLTALEGCRPAVNLAPLVGHGQIRANVMGEDYAHSATGQTLDAMTGHLREAMEAGAFGFSTGLSYLPGVFSDAAELTAMAREAARYGGVYATHFNRVDLATGKGLRMGGIREALDIGRATGVGVEISHIFTGDALADDAAPAEAAAAAERTLAVLEEARRDGVDVYFDIIPNVDGGVAHMAHLYALLHGWVKEAGGLEKFRARLAQESYRQEIRRYVESGRWFMLDPKGDPDWASHTVVLESALTGPTLARTAQALGMDALDALMYLLRTQKDPLMRQMVPQLREEAVKVFIDHPLAMIGSDSFALDATGLYGLRQPVFALPHPNTYGAFIKYLTDYPQHRLEDTVHKITGLPAQRFGLAGRGVIREGYAADLVLLDTARLDSRMDYRQPIQTPAGIRRVMVGGETVMENGVATGCRPGQILRKR